MVSAEPVVDVPQPLKETTTAAPCVLEHHAFQGGVTLFKQCREHALGLCPAVGGDLAIVS